MALPAALLQYAEQHACYSGCYGSRSNVEVFTDPSQPPVPTVLVDCEDCLAYIGVPASLLPKGMQSHQLADRLTEHVRAHRGYTLSISGYHSNGPGFWFTGVYWASCNLFLLSGDRSQKLGSDFDLLMLAFQHGVLKPPVPGMTAPGTFSVQTIYYDQKKPIPKVGMKADLLNAPGISTQPASGGKKLTLAEYVGPPAPAAALPPATVSAPKKSVPKKSVPKAVPAQLAIGQTCPKCGAEYRERTLLYQTFIGCMC